LNDCFRVVGVEVEISDETRIVHNIVHIHSENPYTEFENRFASEYVKDYIALKLGEEISRKFDTYLIHYKENSLFGALCGRLFESHAIERLRRGGRFKVRDLYSGMENELVIPPTQIKQIVKAAERNQSAQLHVPISKNYRGIDAWFPTIGGFQITIAESHKINAKVHDDLPKLGPKGQSLYWVLPPSRYEEFRSEVTQSFEQFALLMENPPIVPTRTEASF